MMTFKAFLLAYADNESDAALYLWDQHHEDWSVRNQRIAREIVKQIDNPGCPMLSSEFEAWYCGWAKSARKIALKYIRLLSKHKPL